MKQMFGTENGNFYMVARYFSVTSFIIAPLQQIIAKLFSRKHDRFTSQRHGHIKNTFNI